MVPNFPIFNDPATFHERQLRLARIRGLEGIPNPSLLQQIELANEKNTAANLRASTYQEGLGRLEEGKLYQGLRGIEEQEMLRPQRQDLERLRLQDEAERIKMERAALGGNLEVAGKRAYERNLRGERLTEARNKLEMEKLGMEMADLKRLQLQEANKPFPDAMFRTVVNKIPAMPQEVGPRSAEEYQSMRMAGGMGGFGQMPAPFVPTGAANQAVPKQMPTQFTPQGMGVSLTPFGGQQNEFQRAYAFGREEEELGRLRMAAEGRRLQGQMAFQPQMEAIRSGIMGRMASRLGVSVPSVKPQPYSSGTGYTPSWMQEYQTPQFLRY